MTVAKSGSQAESIETSANKERQRKSSYDPEERTSREGDTLQLIHDLIGKNEEFFAEPQNRLDFIASQGADGFFRIAQYVNARLRTEKPHQLRRKAEKEGGSLPLRHTPSREDKSEAFNSGYRAIEEYLQDSADSVEKKIGTVAMAVEALVLWVHPFNDGNGRTSRFLAKIIEDGVSDKESLINETVSVIDRNMSYNRGGVETKEGLLWVANNEDIFGAEEPEDMRIRAETLPSDVEGMYISIKQVLEDDNLRGSISHRRNALK